MEHTYLGDYRFTFYPRILQISKKLYILAATITAFDKSKKEKEEKAKEFWEYYEATQGTITIIDPVVLD
ncbi:MAG: hypothetical protein J5529_06750 [Prevotella sp.]|nr:hypothetical protein [Prevotella sp.]